MLKFLVYDNGKPAERWRLRNAYLIGADGSAMRGEVRYEDGHVICEKREAGSCALALQYPVKGLGEMTIQTCLLPERVEPYLLTLELARHRLMTLYTKLEDWGMFELDSEHVVTKRTEKSRQLFVEALSQQGEDPAEADRMAHECLAASLDGSEELALAHSELLLNRRKNSANGPRCPLGCGVDLAQTQDLLRAGLLANFDFVQMPMPWRALAPEEDNYRWQVMDNWMQWASRARLPVVAGPLISFDPANLPDWLYIWEHDYDTVRDLVYEHVERVVKRYKDHVSAWIVVSGLHVNTHMSFNFDQLMDLTRMTTLQVKKLAPSGKSIIELRQPFGEYYSGNPRSIPPQMYSDLLVQSGINFDGLGVRLAMGQAVSGQYTRDLMQISDLFDQYAGFGKPVHLTLAAPSEPVTSMMIAQPEASEPADDNAGHWRRPWSPLVQSHWLEAVLQIAVSKPFVEAVAWQDIIDHPRIDLPLSGLVSESLQPKGSFKRLVAFRQNLSQQHAAAAAVQPDPVGAATPDTEAEAAASKSADAPDDRGEHI
ncbi:endo-1,4-beta-xylanase [Phycisphaerales bacterium AB-hyl4]|uniref:Endo-1,4-beta-xylanase n=1 Tax=Natronomicrosphaera hydrolytica TaxID=3242702 RepID=A0ABV4U7E6_9BACT